MADIRAIPTRCLGYPIEMIRLLMRRPCAQRPDGSTFLEPDRLPSIAVTPQVFGVSGIDNYLPARVGGNGGTAPLSNTFQSSDLRGAYVGAPSSNCGALTGAGQSIGLYLGDGFNQSDVDTFASATNLTGVLPVIVRRADGDRITPLVPTGEASSGEASGDIEAATAMAPQAQVVVFEGSNPDLILARMIDSPDVSQISSSWAFYPSANTQTLLLVMAAQGQSFVTSSGDAGAFQPDQDPNCRPADPFVYHSLERAPTDIRSMDYVTVVGGTGLAVSAGTWAAEVAATFSGGGVLPLVSIPTYQANANPGPHEYLTDVRSLPDVAMDGIDLYGVTTNCGGSAILANIGGEIPISECTGAHSCTPLPCPPGTTTCAATLNACPLSSQTKGQPFAFTGTSLSSPLLAGFLALVNEARSGSTVGFVNPALYQIGKDPARYAASFHDIDNSSENSNSCNVGYATEPGYDLATGWGTPKCGLLDNLTVGSPVVTVKATDTDQGPLFCLSGQGFTKGGTAEIVYAGAPEFGGSLQVVTYSQPISNDFVAGFDYQDDEGAEVSTFIASTMCSDDVINNGVVSVTVIDNDTGISATAQVPAQFWCQVGTGEKYNGGCDPVVISWNREFTCKRFFDSNGCSSRSADEKQSEIDRLRRVG